MALPDIHNAKILVVDDCQRSAASLAELLQIAGYTHVALTTEPAHVIALHAAQGYDLILLDLRMPKVDGLSIMTDMKKTHAADYIPVLAFTGYKSLRHAALEIGALDVILKPYDMREMVLRVRNVLTVRLLYKRMAEKAKNHAHMALHDSLTGLPNRRLLLDRIDNAMHAAKRTGTGLAVLYIDLDGFKAVNDQHGHAYGDAMLKLVTERLINGIRRVDTVARLGGDEFVIILPGIAKPEDAAGPAEKVIGSLSMPFTINAVPLKISASIGIAFYPGKADTADLLLESADTALYQVKRGGKNGYNFAPAL